MNVMTSSIKMDPSVSRNIAPGLRADGNPVIDFQEYEGMVK